jgi:hypothetical protein
LKLKAHELRRSLPVRQVKNSRFVGIFYSL